MNNENKYTSLELSQRLAPVIGGRVEADDLWVERENLLLGQTNGLLRAVLIEDIRNKKITPIRAYRSDTLEQLLPDWLSDIHFYDTILSCLCSREDRDYCDYEDIAQNIHELYLKIIKSRGKAKLDALGELIILLHENGIELHSSEARKVKR